MPHLPPLPSLRLCANKILGSRFRGNDDKGSMVRAIGLAALLLFAMPPAAAQSPGLTIKTGESWMFAISRGQPVRARKVKPTVKPAPGQVVVSLRAMMGTSLSISSNSRQSYTFKAELIGADKTVPVRSCTLPANGRVSFEHWPEKANAVRISDFKVARQDGTCP